MYIKVVEAEYNNSLKRAYEDGYDSGKNQWQDDYGFTVPNKSIQSLERAAYNKGLKDKGDINKSVEYEEYKKGYEHGVQHMKMQNSIDKYSEMSDKLSLTEDEVDNIIDEAFEEGYAQAYSELQTKTEGVSDLISDAESFGFREGYAQANRERELQEKAWDEGYDQAVYDLIDDGLDEEYSEYEFGDVEDDEEDGEEEYCFSKELARVLNGAFVLDTKPTNNTKEDLVNNPSHYNSDPSGVKCIEITRHRNNNIGNTFKYIWRNGLKDGNSDIQDLEKAAWYLNDEIERLKGLENGLE